MLPFLVHRVQSVWCPIMDQCNVLRNSVWFSSDYIMTEGRRVNIALKQSINERVCASYINANYVWASYLTRIGKNAFNKSMAAYHENMRLYKSALAMILHLAQQLWTGFLLVWAWSGPHGSPSLGSVHFCRSQTCKLNRHSIGTTTTPSSLRFLMTLISANPQLSIIVGRKWFIAIIGKRYSKLFTHLSGRKCNLWENIQVRRTNRPTFKWFSYMVWLLFAWPTINLVLSPNLSTCIQA